MGVCVLMRLWNSNCSPPPLIVLLLLFATDSPTQMGWLTHTQTKPIGPFRRTHSIHFSLDQTRHMQIDRREPPDHRTTGGARNTHTPGGLSL
uniref:Putative secreted protein n=1 Tax=Anopheles darlingi TaxID=43151 RepID=A0A2M4D6S1_ANODA